MERTAPLPPPFALSTVRDGAMLPPHFPTCGPVVITLANPRARPESSRAGFRFSDAQKGRARPLAKIITSITGDSALTFDDVLLQPARSDVLPTEVDIRTRVTKDIFAQHPDPVARRWTPSPKAAWRSPWRRPAASA